MTSAMLKIHNTILFARRHGVRHFMHELNYRLTNYYHELRLGVDTVGTVESVKLGLVNTELHGYVPMGYKSICSALQRIPLDKSQCTFLDYGSGKGRAIIVAATLPYRRVIGIEISDQLLGIAKTNIDKMRLKRAKCIDLYNMDATQYTVSEDVNIVYLFNPFRGQVLQRVVSNIRDSYKRSPRKIYIVFFKNEHFENAINNSDWITRLWQTHFYPDCSCGIYVTRG